MLSAPKEVKESLHLADKSVHDFKYTALGDTLTQEIEGKSDSERYLSTMNGLREDFGMSESLLREVLSLLSGILHLGEVHNGSSSSNGAEGVATTEDDVPPSTATEVVEQCCALLQVDAAVFLRELTSRYIDVEGSREYRYH